MYRLIMMIYGLCMHEIIAANTSIDDIKETKLHVYVQSNPDELGRPSLEGSKSLAFFLESKSHGISCCDVYGHNIHAAPGFPPNAKEGWQKLTQTYQVTTEEEERFDNVLSGVEAGLINQKMDALTEKFAEFIKNVCKPQSQYTWAYQESLNEADSRESWVASFYRRYAPSRSKVITGLSVTAITGVLFWSSRFGHPSNYMKNYNISNITDLVTLMNNLH